MNNKSIGVVDFVDKEVPGVLVRIKGRSDCAFFDPTKEEEIIEKSDEGELIEFEWTGINRIKNVLLVNQNGGCIK